MKKNYYILLAGIFIVGLLVFFFSQKPAPIANYPSSGTDVIAFGDSLVQGVGASSPSTSFVSLLSEKIGQPIVNLGVSGNTTQDGINRLSELDNYKPKVVLLLLGGNDKLTQVPKEKTFQNLEIIIQNLQARGAIVLLLGVKGSLIGDNYEADYKNLSKKYHTAYVSDVLSGLFGNAKYMSDTVHPNDLGYKEISDRIYPVIIKLLN